MQIGEKAQFFKAFIKHPTQVGALCPSSRWLARMMLKECDLVSARRVVELGPGTGAFTGLIRQGIGPRTLFLALEVDPEAVKSLHRRFPGLLVYHDSAEHLGHYLACHGDHPADYIISGLPWASLPQPTQDNIFQAVLNTLSAGGVFNTFAYVHACWLPKAVRFRRRLSDHFARVDLSPVVWRNLPPAFVYRCAQPLSSRKS